MKLEILERFWPPGNSFGEGDAVHPIPIYTDLVAIGVSNEPWKQRG